MPTYAYRCPGCGHQFEKFHKMNLTTPHACPQCETVAVQVITGGAGLVFKGSGFYITDYKKAGQKRGKNEEQDSKAAEKESKAGKKEGKAEKKESKAEKNKAEGGGKATDKASGSKKSGGES
jgi:putative FmdB family regulatory protein